jgi:hypothetical protein
MDTSPTKTQKFLSILAKDPVIDIKIIPTEIMNGSSGGEGGTYNNYVPDWLVNHIKITMFKVALLDYNFLRNKI